MRDYAVLFKGWNGKRDTIRIVRATNAVHAKDIATNDNPGWLAVTDVYPV